MPAVFTPLQTTSLRRKGEPDLRQLDLFRRTVIAEDGAPAFEPRTDRWPAKPVVKRDKEGKQHIRSLSSIIKTPEQWPYIQPNPPTVTLKMVFDLDYRDAAIYWRDADQGVIGGLGLPAPNWLAINPESKHAHCAYEVDAVRIIYDEQGRVPMPAYLAIAVEKALRLALQADGSYAGHLVKNPISPAWDVVIYRTEPYTLSYLAEFLHLPYRVDRRCNPDLDTIQGRNAHLFHKLRRVAYREVRNHWKPSGLDGFKAALLQAAEVINEEIESEFPNRGPLGYPEMKDTIKSIADWVWERFSPGAFRNLVETTHTPEIQAERGRRSGEVRRGKSDPQRELVLDLGQGKMGTEIAAELAMPQPTVSRWIAEDRKERLTPEQHAELVALDKHEGGLRSGVARREAQAQQREQARQMAAQGLSRRQIAVEMQVSVSTVSRWLGAKE